jgi:hypothetical protein
MFEHPSWFTSIPTNPQALKTEQIFFAPRQAWDKLPAKASVPAPMERWL